MLEGCAFEHLSYRFLFVQIADRVGDTQVRYHRRKDWTTGPCSRSAAENPLVEVLLIPRTAMDLVNHILDYGVNFKNFPIGYESVVAPAFSTFGDLRYERLSQISVSPGRPDGVKGVYHINAVDIVTQWELVASVERISDAYGHPGSRRARNCALQS